MIMNRPSATAAKLENPAGKAMLGTSGDPLNRREAETLQGLDVDRLNDLAECLFVLNNRRYGPIPGTYFVVCTQPHREWCVGQLNADRNKPILIFEDKVFASADAAREEAERIRQARGESAPCRST